MPQTQYAKVGSLKLAALIGSGCRQDELRWIRAPTLVVHGTDDPLISWREGIMITRGRANARAVLIPGLGHDLPEQLVPRLQELLIEHFALSEKNRRALTNARRSKHASRDTGGVKVN